MSFRHRLAAFLVITLIAVQLITAFFAYGVLRQNAIAEGKRELTASTKVFMRQLDVLSDRVGDEVNVLALDYALRQAIANGDKDTVLSALRNHGRRVGATRMLLVNLDGKIDADTARQAVSGTPFPLTRMIDAAGSDDKATALATFDDGIYWVVAAPVKAPLAIGFIVACVPIDNAMLEKLRTLSLFPNSIALATLDPKHGWTIAASTDGYAPIIRSSPKDAQTQIVDQDTSGALTWTGALKVAPESEPIVAVFDYPLKATLHTFRAVINSMLIVLVGALVLGLAGAMVIARSVSSPIEMLAATARRIAQGDYSPVTPIKEGGEIGALSSDLGNMANAIAEREADLKRTLLDVETARDEAVHANKAKSQFLANMSHELRTPLNAILGFSEVIVHEMMGPIGNQCYTGYARDIHESGRHLLGLVEEMLDLACVEAGTLQIAREPVQLADAIDASITMLDAVARKAGVALIVEGSPRQWPAIDGDRRKLTQAVSNLIHNAIKFSPAGAQVRVFGEVAGDCLKISVADTGIGMRAEDIPTVVKPFQRLASAFDGKYQGAGIGLPFAKSVVELHGGTLHIASAPGAGTTVTIELPLPRATLDRTMTSAA
jgi:signal transduction histidine kinase